MQIRFTKPTKITFITGFDDESKQFKTETKEYAAGDELECEVEGNDIGDLSIHAFFGIADQINPSNFQFLKI